MTIDIAAGDRTLIPVDQATQKALKAFEGDSMGRVLVRPANSLAIDSEEWVETTDLLTGNPVAVRRADCGAGCRCAAEVKLVRRAGEWPESRQLAAQYQSPGAVGIGFARYASTGTVTPELWENITHIESEAFRRREDPAVESWDEDMVKLRQLLAAEGEFPPEQVRLIPNEADSGNPPIGWMELGGLSVALTRSTHDGVLLIALEAQNGGDPVHVRIQGMVGPDENLWEGDIQ